MILGARRPVGQGAAVRRRAALLCERHTGIPGRAAIDLGTEHQRRPVRTVDALREFA
jgi:hypothetical protein